MSGEFRARSLWRDLLNNIKTHMLALSPAMSMSHTSSQMTMHAQGIYFMLSNVTVLIGKLLLPANIPADENGKRMHFEATAVYLLPKDPNTKCTATSQMNSSAELVILKVEW